MSASDYTDLVGGLLPKQGEIREHATRRIQTS